MESRFWRALVVAAIVLALLAGLFGVMLPKAAPAGPELPAAAEAPGTRGFASFETLLSSLTVRGATNLQGETEIGDALTVSDALTVTGKIAASGGLVVVGPTAAATATPAQIINNLGAANDILVLADSGTPVFKIGNSGDVTGKVLSYGSAGQAIICGSTTITGTGALPHALATPQFVQVSLAEDVTADCARLSFTNAAATVTAKCWNSAETPGPATTPVAVDWCVIGTP